MSPSAAHEAAHVSSVRLNWGAVFRCEPDWSWDTKTAPLQDYDLWGVFAGWGVLEAAGTRVELREGDCLILKPGERYTCRHRPDRPLLVHVLHFDFLDPEGRPRSLPPREEPPLHRHLGDVAFFRTLTTRAIDGHARGAEAEADGWLQACLQEVAQQDRMRIVEGETDERTRRLNGLCARITDSPAKAWRVQDLARAWHLSPDHFSRLFKQHTGVSPRQFILDARLDLARRLLLFSSHTVTRIAQLAGFSDVYHFSRQFKAHTGRAPTRFRRPGVAR